MIIVFFSQDKYFLMYILRCITMMYFVGCLCFGCILGCSKSWLSLLLQHCLAKIDRVSFGIMTAEDKGLSKVKLCETSKKFNI